MFSSHFSKHVTLVAALNVLQALMLTVAKKGVCAFLIIIILLFLVFVIPIVLARSGTSLVVVKKANTELFV